MYILSLNLIQIEDQNNLDIEKMKRSDSVRESLSSDTELRVRKLFFRDKIKFYFGFIQKRNMKTKREPGHR